MSTLLIYNYSGVPMLDSCRAKNLFCFPSLISNVVQISQWNQTLRTVIVSSNRIDFGFLNV